MTAPLPGPKAANRRFLTLLRKTNANLNAAQVELEQLRCLEAISLELVEAYQESAEAAERADMFHVVTERMATAVRALGTALEGRT